MRALSCTQPAEHLATTGRPPAGLRLHENVKALDQLLLQLAQEAARQPRGGAWLRATLDKLTQACEAALLHQPLPEIRALLGQVHRQLALLVEMTRRSGRCRGRLHENLSQARQRLQALGQALA